MMFETKIILFNFEYFKTFVRKLKTSQIHLGRHTTLLFWGTSPIFLVTQSLLPIA